jgi:uncharacterized hydrophobic protein (TIGR00341 family)
MDDRLVQITAAKDKVGDLRKLAKRDDVELQTVSALEDGKRTITLLVHADGRQKFLDDVQKELHADGDWRLVVLPVEAIVPEFKLPDEKKVIQKNASRTREELTEDIEKGAALNQNTIILTVLSAVVAAVGMIQDSVPVIIGAMVIAPMLGPILAVILGTSLGDLGLIKRAVYSATVGMVVAIAVGLAAGITVPFEISAPGIAARANVGADSIALALASGAAAALSVMTGISGVLVGVMVAVALLPPAVATGLLIGKLALFEASGALLMLAVNVAALTLAGQVAFLLQGVRPRTFYRMKKAHQSVTMSLLFWTIALMILGGLIFLRSKI